jgi:hypothetical protein
MATTATRSNYWIVTTTSDTTPVFNFRYIVEVVIGGVVKATLKQPKNNAGAAHFNIERIVKNYTEVTNKHANTITGAVDYNSIHLMPRNIPNPSAGVTEDYAISKNAGTCRLVTLRFYEEFASTDGGTISRVDQDIDVTYAFINYANEWEDQMNFDADKYSPYAPSPIEKYLSKIPYESTQPNDTNGRIPHLTGVGDYRTLSFLNEFNTYFTTSNIAFEYKFYSEVPNADLSNYTGQIYLPNLASNGGEQAGTATGNENEMLLFFAAGYENVAKLKYIDYGGYQMQTSDKYYTINIGASTRSSLVNTTRAASSAKIGDKVYIVSAGDTNWVAMGAANNNVGTSFIVSAVGSGTGTFYLMISTSTFEFVKPLLFEISQCSKYPSQSVAWKNKFGTWDYHYFNNNSDESISMTRSIEYERNAGSWNAATFSIDSFERGKVQSVNGTKQITVNTGYLDEAYNDYFKGMMQSNDIQLIAPVEVGDDGVLQEPVPLILIDSQFQYKTTVKDKLIQYSFTFQYAHNLKRMI